MKLRTFMYRKEEKRNTVWKNRKVDRYCTLLKIGGSKLGGRWHHCWSPASV